MPSLIIGIDLGTTTTVVSRINEAGKPELIMNWDNQPFTHSSIWFTKDSPLQPVIGSTARENAGVEEGAFKEYKRDMGTERIYHAHGKQYTPTELSALMLRKQREHIENTCGQKVDMVVITTPANFLNEARAATIAAAKAAGFPDPITTIDEPTAAALFYADSESAPLDGHYLVYDFGGGTLDVTVLEAKAKDIKVKYSMGVAQLGGKDFDETLRNLISQKFKEKTGATMEVTDTGFSDFDAKVNSMNHGKVAVSVSRAEFEEQISALITQAEFCLEGALEKAGLKFADIKGVYMAGGTSKIPAVQRSVERLTGQKPKIRQPEQSISLGAALFAAYKLGSRRPQALSPEVQANVGTIRVQEAIPYFIGTLAGSYTKEGNRVINNSVILRKGQPLPAKSTKTYFVPRNGMNELSLDVTQCAFETIEKDDVTMLADDSMPLGPDSQEGDKIEVTFEIDGNGLFHGTFKDVRTGKSSVIKLTIDPAVGKPPDIDDFLV
jgi:molecular chaperone DnaK